MLKYLRKNKEIWLIPLITLGLTFISYALLSPYIRFFLDDWPQLYSLIIRGVEGIKQYYLFDGRPFGYWPYLIFFRLWGTNPLLWHLTNYLLRWLTTLAMWSTFRALWPTRKREIGWFAILFTVYPLFTQQSIGLMFVVHWTCYLLFGLSLLFMVLAVRNKKYSVLFLTLSFLVDIPNLFTIEYFIGVEFIRPILLWFAYNSETSSKTKIKKTILYWSPFLLLAAFYIFWRLFLLHNLRSDNSPILLNSLLHEPGSTIIQMLNYLFKDITQVILAVWYSTLNADTFDFSIPMKIVALILIGIVIVSSIILYKKLFKKIEHFDSESPDSSFNLQAILLGLAIVILGCAPGWMIMRTTSDPTGLWNDRFGLVAMSGASLFIVGILGLLIRKNQKGREFFLIVLVSLAVGKNFSMSAEYKVASREQNLFFSELKWRAPYIKSETPIYSDNEYFTKMGVYPTAFEFNLVYPMVELMPRTDYWYYQLHLFSDEEIKNLIKGQKIDAVKWYIYFEAESNNGLIINWHPDQKSCVWVLTENDRLNPLISLKTAQSLKLTNLDRIDTNADDHLPSSNLFGYDNSNTWCYYFEKADLARQTGDWVKVTQLYSDAENKGFIPSNGVELMPFIEGFARTGNAEKSYQLTLEAISKTDNLTPYMCDNWNRFAPALSSDASVQAAYNNLSNAYSCRTYLNQ